MRAAGLDQQDLVLAEMLMPWDDASGRNLLCTRKHLLRAAIFSINLNRERPGRQGSLPGSSKAMFSFVFLENQRRCLAFSGRRRVCILRRGTVHTEEYGC